MPTDPSKRARTVVSAKLVSRASPSDIDAIVKAFAPEAIWYAVEPLADFGEVDPVPGGRATHLYEARLARGVTIDLHASLLFYDEYDLLVLFETRASMRALIGGLFGRVDERESITDAYVVAASERIARMSNLHDVRWYFRTDFDRDFGDTWSRDCLDDPR